MNVLSFVNGGTSTSFQVEISAKIDEITDANVEIASFYDHSIEDVDPDVANLETKIHPLGATSRFDTKAYRRLRSLLSDFDILHTHYNFVGSAGRLASIGTDVKIVNTEHASHRYYSFPQRLVNVPSFKLVDAMVFNSQNTRNSLPWYERALIDEGSSHTIYNGVDMDRVDRAKSFPQPELPDGRIILSACRMVSVKNLETLVRAFATVASNQPDIALVLIGDGPERKKLQQLGVQLNISDRIYFLGYLSREAVYSAMHRSDIFAVPSYHEGFCNAAVEAMSCGLPVVVSDIPVFREVIGANGQFADPNSPIAFARGLEMILSNEQTATKLSKSAQIYSKKRFPIEQSAEEYYRLYYELLNDNSV